MVYAALAIFVGSEENTFARRKRIAGGSGSFSGDGLDETTIVLIWRRPYRVESWIWTRKEKDVKAEAAVQAMERIYTRRKTSSWPRSICGKRNGLDTICQQQPAIWQ